MRNLGLLLLLGNVMWFAACGGNGGGSSRSTVTSVSVGCSPGTITPGQTSQCTATVSGTGNFSTAVTWSASAGTISSSGLFTAPGTDTSLLVTITATSVQNTSVSGTANVTVNPSTGGGGSNTAQIVVDAGPLGGEANIAYVTVHVCVPNTSTCQDIDHVQVDTGSEGLRLNTNVLSLSLPPETVGGNALDECLLFADGYVWGPVLTASVTLGGETAANVPVHVLIPSNSSPPVPQSCMNQSSGGNRNEGGNATALGANGILGVGPFQNDCGQYCVIDGATCDGTNSAPCVYYQCPSSGCTATNVAQPQQVPNPVTLFTADNNGVLVQLPALTNNQGSNVQGSLIFGINTQTNNNLSLAATLYPIPDSGSMAGDLVTTYNGHSYNTSFLDSGSNGLYFLNSNLTSIPACSGNSSGFYCPNNPVMVTATNQGQDSNGNLTGVSGAANFTIENALNLFNSNNCGSPGSCTAFSTLGGPFFTTCGTGNNPACAFDFGSTFFYGRNVFTAIDGAAVSGAPTGPFFAY